MRATWKSSKLLCSTRPFLKRDLAILGERQPHHRRALDLRADALRVDAEAAVDRGVDARDGEVALVVHRHLRPPSRRSSRSCDARRCRARGPSAASCPSRPARRRARRPGAAGRCRSDRSRTDRRSSSTPSDLLAQIDDARRPDHLQQHVLRIAPSCARDLGDERLHREGVRDVGDRAEPADARMRLRPRRSRSACSAMSNGLSTSPMPSSIGARASDPARRSSMIVGADAAVPPRDHLAAGIDARPRSARPRRCGRSRAGCRPRASTTTLTGAPPSPCDSSAASST